MSASNFRTDTNQVAKKVFCNRWRDREKKCPGGSHNSDEFLSAFFSLRLEYQIVLPHKRWLTRTNVWKRKIRFLLLSSWENFCRSQCSCFFITNRVELTGAFAGIYMLVSGKGIEAHWNVIKLAEEGGEKSADKSHGDFVSKEVDEMERCWNPRGFTRHEKSPVFPRNIRSCATAVLLRERPAVLKRKCNRLTTWHIKGLDAQFLLSLFYCLLNSPAEFRVPTINFFDKFFNPIQTIRSEFKFIYSPEIPLKYN